MAATGDLPANIPQMVPRIAGPSPTGPAAPIGATVTIAGEVFSQVTHARVERDLQNIAGSFELTVIDETRVRAALMVHIGLSSENVAIKAGAPISIFVDGEIYLVGYIGKPQFRWHGETIECHITGRDKTGDLVDCAALPNGPVEFRGVDLTHVAKQVCEPFGIPVIAEVDVGAPFERLALHKHQTALTFLEGAARQRSVLLVSNGIGGLLLTRGGSSRGPAPLRVGDNVQEVNVEFDWDQRFSDYFVTQDSGKKRHGGPRLDHTAVPLESPPPLPTQPSTESDEEAPSIGPMGHAIDPEVLRWRPTVRLTRSQSGMDTVQEQAEWMARVARGTSDHVHFSLLEWRAGPKKALWRPNQIVAVSEPYSGIQRDMLIAGVSFTNDPQGRRTVLRLAGVTAYDRINEAERRKHRGGGKAGPGNLDRTAVPLGPG